MWKYIVGFFIFCLVLFIYLHVNFHLKTGNELEVYELEGGSKDKLEEICDLRQPVIMNFYNDTIFKTCKKQYILANYRAFEMKIRNTKEDDYTSEIYLPLQAHSAFKLLNEDKTGSYITENNSEFLEETGILKILQSEDEFIRPGLTSNCTYDFCAGSENSVTPFRYEINYRNYIYVTSGEIEIKMAPPKCSKYLHPIEDYDNFEFRSPIHPWLVQEKYQYDFDKIKCMDVLLPAGKMIYVPPYWWYSIRYKENGEIVSFKYRTYMNNVAIAPQLGMHFLQRQNIQHNVIKKYEAVKVENMINEEDEEKDGENDREKEKEPGVTNINELLPIEHDNVLPPLNSAINPVQELEIPTSL